jgi:hypothetical protein
MGSWPDSGAAVMTGRKWGRSPIAARVFVGKASGRRTL